MDMYYIGDNDNEFGFKYGSSYDVVPAEENDIELECIGIEVYERSTENGYKLVADYFLRLDNFINSFTPYEFNVIDEDIPKKPYIDNGNRVCPNCLEIVTEDFSECENCGQALDWG